MELIAKILNERNLCFFSKVLPHVIGVVRLYVNAGYLLNTVRRVISPTWVPHIFLTGPKAVIFRLVVDCYQPGTSSTATLSIAYTLQSEKKSSE